MKNLESREYPHVVALRCAPLPVVRIAFIGLGHRGRQSLVHYMYLDGVEVRAVCDLQRENREEARAVLESHGMPAADEYRGADDWKEVCRRDDIDLVYVCTASGCMPTLPFTPWNMASTWPARCRLRIR